jgi:rhodanese-related sulfurtransferase
MPTTSRSQAAPIPPATAKQARRHFEERLAYETDPADVWKAIESATADFVLVDCRPKGSYEKAHIPGAISLPWREIDEERAHDLPEGLIVTYCWGPSCNAATKGRRTAAGRSTRRLASGRRPPR